MKQCKYVNWKDREEYVLNYTNLPIWPHEDVGMIKALVKHARGFIVTYGVITLGDLYDLIGMYTGIVKNDISYRDWGFGWTRYSDICVRHTPDGVTIGLYCDPIPIRKQY